MKALPAKPTRSWIRWQPDAIVAVVFISVVVFGHEYFLGWPGSWRGPDPADAVAFIGIAALGVACARAMPGLAISLIWLSTLLQVNNRFDILLSQLAALYVVGMAARFGSRTWVALSGLSILLGSALGTLYMIRIDSWLVGPVIRAVEYNQWPSSNQVIAVFVATASMMTLPWLLGLMIRLFAGKQSAELYTAQAREEADNALELARLRAENAALARDVHDVVGHSLAVIIAQADAIRFIPDSDVAKIRETTGTIAEAARRSLGEVRHVLSQTAEATTPDRGSESSEALKTAQLGLLPPRTSDISAILDNVRATGYDVTEETLGEPVPLPAGLLPVIRRIIQEMLANALHHGTETTPIYVRHYWGATSYTLSVTNYFEVSAPNPRSGTGLGGMRERLASVAGTLSIDTDEGDGGAPSIFTIAATFPLNNEWTGR
ncbi:sensor histidine kinase [Paeniglutamicibacter sp. NPDC091659]|uniref:sensor histidine kinase n=1 Tax=Paeniglutamicibacter sp. NPDC091659 TaxID=3364389 RepID=UPI00382DC727